MNTIMHSVADQTTQRTGVEQGQKRQPKRLPAYHVILLDDDDHTYDYVIGMLRKLFGHTSEKAFQLASEVDQSGRVILDTTSLERAELKRDQIHSFGRDWRIRRCEGSMSGIIEPAPQ